MNPLPTFIPTLEEWLAADPTPAASIKSESLPAFSVSASPGHALRLFRASSVGSGALEDHDPSNPRSLKKLQECVRVLVDQASSSSTVLDQSMQYLDSFITQFIVVDNYLKQEHLFDDSEVAEGVVQLVLSFLESNVQSEKTAQVRNDLELGMKLLRILSRTDALATFIGKTSGLHHILDIMQSFPTDVPLQINCSATFANLAAIDENRWSMMDLGIVDLIVGHIHTFLQSPTVLVEIFATISNLSNHDQFATKIVALDGCEKIMKAMRRHFEKPELQVQGLYAIASLAKAGRENLVKEDFMALLMRLFEYGSGANVDVEVLTGWCLAAVTVCCSWSFAESTCIAALQAVGSLAVAGMSLAPFKLRLIRRVCNSMRKLDDNPSFLITAYFSLAHLAQTPPIDVDYLSEFSAIEMMLDGMKRFYDYESLQTTALFALGTILPTQESSDKYRVAALEHGAVKLVLDAMKRDYSTSSWNGNKRRDSGFVIEKPKCQDQPTMTAGKGTQLEAYPVSVLLQLFGCITLLNLSDNEKCKDAIIAEGGIHFIHNAVSRMAGYSELWFIALFAFARFTKPNGDEYGLYLQPRGVPSLRDLAAASHLNAKMPRAGKSMSKPDGSIFKKSVTLQVESLCLAMDRCKITDSSMEHHKAVIESLPLPNELKRDITTLPMCVNCGRICHKYSLRLYKVHTNQTTEMVHYCNEQCARKDKKFDKRIVHVCNMQEGM
ncbi:hypothetical protein HDV00_004199 [Rhizophlyctis rosea]|nr:hypothetical protein HDV00_004199 [Rhizophlyctis rosea]